VKDPIPDECDLCSCELFQEEGAQIAGAFPEHAVSARLKLVCVDCLRALLQTELGVTLKRSNLERSRRG